MKEVAQLVCEKSEPLIERLNTIIRQHGISLIGVFRDSLGDSVIETAIECSKFVCFDRCFAFNSEVSDCLTQITIIVNDLLNREPVLHQLAPMNRRRSTHLRQYCAATGRAGDFSAAHGVRGLLDLEGLDQLIEK